MAPSYGARAEEFGHWACEPGQVFTAPDRTAYAQLAWLWECRYAVFTTVCPDGRLIQTMTAWEADPEWPTALVPFRRWTNRQTEQLALATDPAADVVDGLGPAWTSHRRRVATVGPVPEHSDLDHFVEMWAAESAARSAWSTRVRLAAVVIAVVLVAGLCSAVTTLLGARPWWLDLGVLVAAVVGVVPVFVIIWMRARRWRWLRRPFRAAVPGA